MSQQARECQFENSVPARCGVVDQRLDGIEVLLRQKLAVALVLRDAGVFGNRLSLPVFPGQQAALEWKERQERDPQTLALTEHPVFGLALEQTVFVLDAY